MIIRNLTKIRELSILRSRDCFTVFNGINEAITVADDALFDFEWSDPFSIMVWVFIPSLQNGSLVTKRNDLNGKGWSFYMDVSGRLIVELRSGAFANGQTMRIESEAASLTAGAWNLATVTLDGSGTLAGTNMYIYDTLKATVSLTGRNTINSGTIINTNLVYIGVGGIGGWLTGNLDECTIWDSELSLTDITSIYNIGKMSPDYSGIAGLVSDWALDSLNPIDRKNGKNGTSLNMDENNIQCS